MIVLPLTCLLVRKKLCRDSRLFRLVGIRIEQECKACNGTKFPLKWRALESLNRQIRYTSDVCVLCVGLMFFRDPTYFDLHVAKKIVGMCKIAIYLLALLQFGCVEIAC